MSTEITEYIATKLSKNAKRGGGRDRVDSHNDKRILDMPATRSPEQLRAAQLQLAILAVEHPDLGSDRQRQLWLEEVLEALDLRHEVIVKKTAEELPCEPHTGTMRGYNIHLRGYTSPCTKCKNVEAEEQARRLRNLGVEQEGEKWLLSRT